MLPRFLILLLLIVIYCSISQAGNKDYREIVEEFKVPYLYATKHKEIETIIQQVFHRLEAEGRHFVEKAQDGAWVEADPKKIREKVAQTLRDGAPNLRKELATARATGQDLKSLEVKGKYEVTGDEVNTKTEEQQGVNIDNLFSLDRFTVLDVGMQASEAGYEGRGELDTNNIVPLDPSEDNMWSFDMGDLFLMFLENERDDVEEVTGDQMQNGSGASVVSVHEGDWLW